MANTKELSESPANPKNNREIRNRRLKREAAVAKKIELHKQGKLKIPKFLRDPMSISDRGDTTYHLGGRGRAHESVELSESPANPKNNREIRNRRLKREAAVAKKIELHKQGKLKIPKFLRDPMSVTDRGDTTYHLGGRGRAHESVDIQELSKKTLGSYVKKASISMAGSAVSQDTTSEKQKAKMARHDYKKRKGGIERAVNKMSEESVDQFLSGDLQGFTKSFAVSMAEKVSDIATEKKKEIAQSYFAQEE